jgi:DeoR family fructose operon transcriptional repressor
MATPSPETTGAERIDSLVRLLREQTSASIPEMAELFGVSEMTIRRDLTKLAQSGQAIRIPGGARIARSFGLEKTFVERLQRMSEAKDRIGRAAASLVGDGESVGLDSGTTTLCIARHLRRRQRIVVVTFSLAVVEELAGSESVRVELTGGTYRSSSHDLIGHAVSQSLRSLSADRVFFGASAVSFRKGVMVYDPEFRRELLVSARERILVADSSKIGREALYHVCPLESCDLVITDSGIGRGDLVRLRRKTRVLVAE